MSKKDNPKSYFENTFGKAKAAPAAGQNDDFEATDEASKKKGFSKEYKTKEGGARKSGAEGRFEHKERSAPRKRYEDKDSKPFERRDNSDAPRKRYDDKDSKPFERRDNSDAPRKRYDDKDSKPFERRADSDAPRKRYEDKDRKPFERRADSDAPRKRYEDKDRKPFERRDDSDAPRKRYDDKDSKPFERRADSDAPRKRYDDKKAGGRFDDRAGRSYAPKEVPNRRPNFDPNDLGDDKPSPRDTDKQTVISRDNQVHNVKIGAHLKPNKRQRNEEKEEEDDLELPEITEKEPEKMPLNKYIAHCGICSRRDAVEYIKQGKVKVNGVLAEEPGMKISEGDAVSVAGKKIVPTKNLAYILLNKPKGFITTTEDEKGRKTIMDLVASSEVERLYPIGRLDRNTTGLIILTNDGELAQKLSHPKYNVKKIYQVTLDKHFNKADFEKVLAGVSLEDGIAPVDSLAMLEEKNEVGIEIHSGKNRIVRRIFEHLGYQVEKLDRVMYAGLTKKNLPRGKWRLLTDREVILLKHFKS